MMTPFIACHWPNMTGCLNEIKMEALSSSKILFSIEVAYCSSQYPSPPGHLSNHGHPGKATSPAIKPPAPSQWNAVG